jgi:hypothetical protein
MRLTTKKVVMRACALLDGNGALFGRRCAIDVLPIYSRLRAAAVTGFALAREFERNCEVRTHI